MSTKKGYVDNRKLVQWMARVGKNGLKGAPAMVRNASLSGVYFETLAELDVKNRIQLECQIEYSGDIHPLVVECEVVRCAPTDRPGIRGYGANFVKLGRENLNLLLPILTDLLVRSTQGEKLPPQERRSRALSV
jgi:hypothetical protein